MPPQLPEVTASVTRAAHRIFAEAACDVALTLALDGRIDFATEGAATLLGATALNQALRGHNIFSFAQETCAG